MDKTDLAHWRYRAKALESDLIESRSDLRKAGFVYAQAQSMGLDLDYTYLDEALKFGAESVELNRWLLEEARYMSELGALNQRVYP